MYSLQEEKIIKSHVRKELLVMFRKTLTAVSKINFKDLQIDTTASFRQDEFNFHITIFNLEGMNVTFTFYDFSSVKENKETLEAVMTILKTGNFSKIEDWNNRT